ncbi:MAG: flagellar motor protein MotS [Rhodothalassiaceae bacterium]
MIKRPEIAPAPSLAGAASQSWMVSLADLLALMLTFFVLLFSMNAVQLSEWQAVMTSFRKEFNPHAARIEKTAREDADGVRRFRPAGSGLDYLAALMSHRLVGGEWEGARVTRLSDRIVLSLPSDTAFAPGSAVLTPTARAALGDLAVQFARLENAITIHGHTDPTPVSGRRFASNWELSLRRADAVARALSEAGYRRAVRVFGHADANYGDISPALPEAERRRLGRRIDIAILATGEGA